jgi:DNA primase
LNIITLYKENNLNKITLYKENNLNNLKIMNLPEAPGRARRLSYGNYIRNNTRINNTINHDNFNTRNNTRINNTRINNTRNHDNFNTINDDNFNTINDDNFNTINDDIIMRSVQTVELVEIENIIEKRLLIKDLLKKSSIYFTKHLFSCSICLNETNKDNIIRRLICSHDFHINCIEMWLSDNTTCPMCRYDLM